MKPTNKQTIIAAENKIDEIYEEILACGKNSKNDYGKNFSTIRAKFWKLINKIEKMLDGFPHALDDDKKEKLASLKKKF